MAESMQCYQCGTRMKLQELVRNNDDCPECGAVHTLKDVANALDLNTRAQLPSQGGEAVEVVAHLVLGGIFHGGSGPELGDIDYQIEVDVAERLQLENVKTSEDVQLELMTVAQHQRIVAGLTVTDPDAVPVRRELLEHAAHLLSHAASYMAVTRNESVPNDFSKAALQASPCAPTK